MTIQEKEPKWCVSVTLLEGSLVRGVEVALTSEVALGGGRGITLLTCLESAHIDSQYGRE